MWGPCASSLMSHHKSPTEVQRTSRTMKTEDVFTISQTPTWSRKSPSCLPVVARERDDWMSAREVSSHSKVGLPNVYPCYFPGETLVPKNLMGLQCLSLFPPHPDKENYYPHLTHWVSEVKCFCFGVSQEVRELGLRPTLLDSRA